MQTSTPQSKKRKVESISQQSSLQSAAESTSRVAGVKEEEQPTQKRPRRTADQTPEADLEGFHVASLDPTVSQTRSTSSSSSAGVQMSAPPSGGIKFSLRHSGGPVKQPIKKISVNIRASDDSKPNGAFENEAWDKIGAAVRAVQTRQPVRLTLEQLYQTAEDFLTFKLAETLYKRLETEIQEHLQSEQQRVLSEPAKDEAAFLVVLNRAWLTHCDNIMFIRNMLLPLDRKYAVTTTGVRSLWDMGLHHFRQKVASQPDIQRKALIGILHQIEAERRGNSVDRNLLKSLIRMYITLQLYTDVFEKPFLDATEAFYTEESKNFISSLSVAMYLARMEGRLDEEANRVVVYLDHSTRKALISTVERVVLTNHLDIILGKGFDQLLDDTSHADLSRAYALLERVDALKNLRFAWNVYVKTRGKALVSDKTRDKQIVEDLLHFKQRLDDILTNSFAKNDDFSYAMKEGFETFMKERQDAMPNLVSTYIHKKLQSGNKVSSDFELESLLDKVIHIFRFLPSKDKFESCYTRHLSKRLLFGKSVSVDAEKLMISRLKTECGAQFTQKIEKMMNDMELSKELNNNFKEQHGDSLKSEMNVLVLTHGSWPEEPYKPLAGLKLPSILANYQDLFTKFYTGKYTGRKLTFLHHRSTCIVRASFTPKNRKELNASLSQTAVLMLFNDVTSLSFQDIQEALGIQDVEEVKRVLQSLSCLKFKVLAKTPKSKDVATSDSFELTTELASKLYRVKLNQLQMKDTQEEEKKIEEETVENRKFATQAAIVRIMKARKELNHNQLISEVVSQLRFPVKPTAIKKEIEQLLERDYLKRREDDQNVYTYVA